MAAVPPVPELGQVVAALEAGLAPALEPAGFVLRPRSSSTLVEEGIGPYHLFLFESSAPIDVAARHPELRLEESYGPQWPPPCLDVWIWFEHRSGRATADVEGHRLPDAGTSADVAAALASWREDLTGAVDALRAALLEMLG